MAAGIIAMRWVGKGRSVSLKEWLCGIRGHDWDEPNWVELKYTAYCKRCGLRTDDALYLKMLKKQKS